MLLRQVPRSETERGAGIDVESEGAETALARDVVEGNTRKSVRPFFGRSEQADSVHGQRRGEDAGRLTWVGDVSVQHSEFAQPMRHGCDEVQVPPAERGRELEVRERREVHRLTRGLHPRTRVRVGDVRYPDDTSRRCGALALEEAVWEGGYGCGGDEEADGVQNEFVDGGEQIDEVEDVERGDGPQRTVDGKVGAVQSEASETGVVCARVGSGEGMEDGVSNGDGLQNGDLKEDLHQFVQLQSHPCKVKAANVSRRVEREETGGER